MRGRIGVLAALLCACAPAPTPWRSPGPQAWRSPGPQAWRGLRESLEEQREAIPTRPWSAGVRVVWRDPRLGRDLDARGAVAVAPGRAVRMILVGGPGSTMLDAWVSRRRWRVAVPALGRLRRGQEDEPRDLPVGLLRWWFLTPFEGTLFAAASAPGQSLWVLRDRDAVIELQATSEPGGTRLEATRRHEARIERVDACCSGPSSPRAGDTIEYADEATGVRVRITVESVSTTQPEEQAFRDPDATEAEP